MPGPRTRPIDLAAGSARRLAQRLGTDARTARLSVGWTQRTVARRSRVSQATVSRLESGDARLSVVIVSRIAFALGMELSARFYPGGGIGLRDSGQLALADVVRGEAHRSWRIGFEVPVSEESRQAADVVLSAASGGLHLELESRLVDFQAQLRSGQLKRDAMQRRYGTRLAFVLALRDTEANRAAVRAHVAVIAAALPATASEVWHAIRAGEPLRADGLLWLRPVRRRRADSPVDVIPHGPLDSGTGVAT
ncbi:MAG: helix-turn-helix transcriptional regulator [Chloroflexota bacterium]